MSDVTALTRHYTRCYTLCSSHIRFILPFHFSLSMSESRVVDKLPVFF